VVAFEVVVVVVPADGHCDATCEDEEEEEEVDELAAAAAVLGGPPVARCRSDEAALASVDEWWVGTAAAGKSEDKPKGCAGDGDSDSDVGNGDGQVGFDDDAGDGGAVEADEIGGGKSDMSGNVRAPCGATGGIATKLWPWSWPGWAASFTRVALGTV
jgi:hypothetical protein